LQIKTISCKIYNQQVTLWRAAAGRNEFPNTLQAEDGCCGTALPQKAEMDSGNYSAKE
jgi:hypothetical protein